MTGALSATVDRALLAASIESRLLERNDVSERFFAREAPILARACQQMAERFMAGGTLLAFGRNQYATDAQHVSVEFVHPVIVGKRALPALDLSAAFREWLSAIVRHDDIVMGFGPPHGDVDIAASMRDAKRGGAQTFAFGGGEGDYTLARPTDDAFICQEMVEVLYHTLWETVHVFLEHRERGHDLGQAAFLYPFLGRTKQDTSPMLDGVASSIVAKSRDDERLRSEIAATQVDAMISAIVAVRSRIDGGGKLIWFGNGGSATDANDGALDCVAPASGRAIPAISLAMEPANVTAIANDVGTDAIFLRQLIAHANARDVAIAISTSGGSANVIAALVEARRRGLLTVALLGYDGGEIARRALADVSIVVASDYIPRIQEVQASIYHLLIEHVGTDAA